MIDDLEREVDEWFDELEGQLVPVGRVTSQSPDDGVRPVLSHPSKLAVRRPV